MINTKKKFAVAFTILILAVLGLTVIFVVYAPQRRALSVGQVDSALGGSWLRENNESFVFSVLADNSVRIKYFNGSVQTIPPNYKGEVGGLQDFGPGIIDSGGLVESFKQSNGGGTLTLTVLDVSNTEAHIFINGLNTTPNTVELQSYRGYLFSIEGNSLVAVYNYRYIIYISWAGANFTQAQLMKLLNYLAE